MIERLPMESKYSAIEASIHMGRYSLAKKYCKNKIILDIACGEGYGTRLLKNWGAKKVVGLDISEESVKQANKEFSEKGIDYIVHDATDLSCFKDNTFDMIVSFETIEHLQNPLKFLKEIKRVATKDAIIIITCPNDYLYYPKENEHNPYHIKKYTFEDFKLLLNKVFDKNITNYMIGTKAEGFLNTFPNEYNKNMFQKDMINNYEQILTQMIYSDKKIDFQNCSYYIAFINVNNPEPNSVIFPTTIYRWVPDPIDKINVLSLANKEENDYLKNNIVLMRKKIDNMNEQIKELENQCGQLTNLVNSKTYKFSLILYRIYKKLFWWR